MAQTTYDYNLIFYQHTLKYNDLVSSLLAIMDRCGFELMQTPFMQTYCRLDFGFIPLY